MPNSRMELWRHPVAPAGVLLVALHIIKHYAYAGHGEFDSFDQMATLPSLQTALENHRGQMSFETEQCLLWRNSYVIRLSLVAMSTTRGHVNSMSFRLLDLPGLLDLELRLLSTLGSLRIKLLQNKALRDKTQILEVQQAGQPE